MAAPTTDLALDDIRLGYLETWLRPDREGIFAKLRAERPVSFHAEQPYELPGDADASLLPSIPPGPG